MARPLRRHVLALGSLAALFLAVSSPLSLAACGEHGSGRRVTENRAVGAFTEVAVEGTITLELAAGATPALVLEGDDNLLPRVDTSVVGSRLTIAPQGSMTLSGGLFARATAPSVGLIVGSGSGEVKVTGASGAKLVVELGGARKASLEGRVDELVLRVSGASSVDARKLDARTVSIDASGSSSLELGAPTTLTVKASGATSVRYDGAPALTQDVTGSSSVQAR